MRSQACGRRLLLGDRFLAALSWSQSYLAELIWLYTRGQVTGWPTDLAVKGPHGQSAMRPTKWGQITYSSDFSFMRYDFLYANRALEHRNWTILFFSNINLVHFRKKYGFSWGYRMLLCRYVFFVWDEFAVHNGKTRIRVSKSRHASRTNSVCRIPCGSQSVRCCSKVIADFCWLFVFSCYFQSTNEFLFQRIGNRSKSCIDSNGRIGLVRKLLLKFANT